MVAVVQKTLPGDMIAIEIDQDGDGQIDATRFLTVGAAGYSPQQVTQLRTQSGKQVSVAVKAVEMSTGHYNVEYALNSPGHYNMFVLLNNRSIAKSPYTLEVVGKAFDPKSKPPVDRM